MKKAFFLLLLAVFAFSLVGCVENPPVIEDTRYTLTDLTGKTQSQIEAIFEEVGITVQFREVQSSTVAAGTFIRYVGYNVGDKVETTVSIRIEIAIPVPSAPTINGADEASVYVSVQGNPPTFDIYAGVTATDFQGNDIPFGNFFYVLEIKDSNQNTLSEVNFYQIGVYYVTYQAMNSGLSTTVTRTINVVVPPFDTNNTDNLQLAVSYAGKSFINDGIGVVTITTHTDADTTNFRDSVTGERFTVRYLGIDAPEATSKYEPWGIKAANFVRETLDNAETIILQAEGVRTDGNERYLAWVWYIKDGKTRLLNLELVEEAYAWTSAVASTQYGSIFVTAQAETQLTGRRIYGEVDPDFDYSTGGTPIEIGALLDNFNDYIAKKVTITGVITSKVGNSIYIEQNNRGIYMYAGYNMTNELQIGYEVTIQGLVPAVYFQSKQLSNYTIDNMILLSTDNPVTISTIAANQVSQYVGRVVRIEDLTVTQIQLSQSGLTTDAYTVVARDSNNNTINIRVDDYTAKVVPSYTFSVGAQFSVTAPVTQFNSGYQLMLPGMGNIEFNN
ncbi:thermonuclease family protein [Paracholeplasma manati]|uniref:thermonuclease family protein n=1 Tax=Paracholeplasma manati TaxID=591373 RepID=UPI002407A1BB|nr:thermonuclease family protein [Paracholeplasma manati]MDG0889438.1 thermonuclease family protein [Paracholeplasma manati]